MVLKSHQCFQCDYTATQKGDLQRHIKSVHEGITHQCPHCKHKTALKYRLMRHIKLNHIGENLDDPDTELQSTVGGEDDFISDEEERELDPVNDIKIESAMQPEQEYFEPDIKVEKLPAAENDDFETTGSKSAAGIKIESTMQKEQEYFEADIKIEKLPAAGNDDFNISDDEEDQCKEGDECATGQRYLCPISSCTFSHSLRDGDNQQDQERAHFMTSHSDVQNIDNLNFIRL